MNDGAKPGEYEANTKTPRRPICHNPKVQSRGYRERLRVNQNRVHSKKWHSNLFLKVFIPKLSLKNDNFTRRADNSFSTKELSGLTPTLKLSGFLTLYHTTKPLSFNVGPELKKGLTTFLGSSTMGSHDPISTHELSKLLIFN